MERAVTRLIFVASTIVNASNFISSLTQEGPNNHRILAAAFQDGVLASASEVPATETQGTVIFNVADTQALRSWVDEHARGVKGIEIMRFEAETLVEKNTAAITA